MKKQSNFHQRFKNKISRVTKQGTISSTGEVLSRPVNHGIVERNSGQTSSYAKQRQPISESSYASSYAQQHLAERKESKKSEKVTAADIRRLLMDSPKPLTLDYEYEPQEVETMPLRKVSKRMLPMQRIIHENVPKKNQENQHVNTNQIRKVSKRKDSKKPKIAEVSKYPKQSRQVNSRSFNSSMSLEEKKSRIENVPHVNNAKIPSYANDKTGSYAHMHSTKKNFTPYSLNDYKNMKMKDEALSKLGGLGADLQNEEVLKRRQKIERMKAYGLAVTNENAEFLVSTKRRSEEKQKPLSKRERALQFASRIPKPKIKKPKKQVETTSNERESDSSSLGAYEPPQLSELELLELQHRQDEQWLNSVTDD